MRLYHVSLYKLEKNKQFTPRIPELKEKSEEPSTPRICFCPSVQQCFEALLPKQIDMFTNMDFSVYTVDTDSLQPEDYVTNKIIAANNWVYDAASTGEVWVTKSLNLSGTSHKLLEFEIDRIILFNQVTIDDVFTSLERLGVKSARDNPKFKDVLSSEELYRKCIACNFDLDSGELVDTLFDDIAGNVPLCQGYRVMHLRYTFDTEFTSLFSQ